MTMANYFHSRIKSIFMRYFYRLFKRLCSSLIMYLLFLFFDLFIYLFFSDHKKVDLGEKQKKMD